MNVEPKSLEWIFQAALEKTAGAERSAFLEQACLGRAELAAEVRKLLAAHEDRHGPLDQLVGAMSRTEPWQGSAEQAGKRIGPYKLLEQVGVGGMGVVYIAEQHEPVRRRVALKLIKPGMDSSQVIARFEQERQALALMDHPNIARVLDAGTTQEGLPYFVMELVKGIPITRFCDQEQLSLHERLALFVPVCRAVQHAHQKGVIHRDLKPSNVLVALYDGSAGRHRRGIRAVGKTVRDELLA